MSQPAASGGYVPQPGGHYDPIYAQQQQQQHHHQHQQLYAYNSNNAGVAHPAPLAHTTSASSSRSTLRNIVGASTFLNAVGGLCVFIGALLPIRRYTFGPFVLEYYLYTGRLDGESFPLGDTLQTPYAIAMSLAMICGFLALFIALPIGIYDIRALSHQVEQPHQRRGCVRFMRTIVLLIAIKMGAMASLMSMFTTTVDSYGDEDDTFSTSNLCEGFALLVIGTGLLALSDILCLCHVIMAARVPENGGDQQQLIHNQQQYHPQHQYPQHQQHYQAAPTVYQGVPIGGGGGDHSTSTTSTPINAAPHPGYHHPNASYT